MMRKRSGISFPVEQNHKLIVTQMNGDTVVACQRTIAKFEAIHGHAFPALSIVVDPELCDCHPTDQQVN